MEFMGAPLTLNPKPWNLQGFLGFYGLGLRGLRISADFALWFKGWKATM